MDMFGASDYEYEIVGNVVVIYDLNQGGRSVTNDIDNVLATIGKSVDLTDKKIIYRDSCGVFDGVTLDAKRFYPINKKTLEAALKHIGENIH